MTDHYPPILFTAPDHAQEQGGLGLLADGQAIMVDRIASSGLCSTDNGEQIVRATLISRDPFQGSAIVTYNRSGIQDRIVVKELIDPHSVIEFEGHYVVVSTMTNELLWVTKDGVIAKRWSPGSVKADCWHLNNLFVLQKQLYVSAFGKFDTHRAWAQHGARNGNGFVYDVQNETIAVSGLTSPHTPTFVDNSWIICDSGTGSVLRIKDNLVLQTVDLKGWTRGLQVTDDHIFVGVSAHREARGISGARIDVLNRRSLDVVDSIPLPTKEVFDLLVIDRGLATAIAGTAGHFTRSREWKLRRAWTKALPDTVVRPNWTRKGWWQSQIKNL